MAEPSPNRGNSTTSAMATACMTFSTSALTAWHVRSARFIYQKEATKAQLLEAKANLLRLRQDIPLADAELAAVEEGVGAYERLLATLADVLTPGGSTPRQLTAGRLVQLEKTRD
jgi:hypothetical protein